jgi:hypothetical protein
MLISASPSSPLYRPDFQLRLQAGEISPIIEPGVGKKAECLSTEDRSHHVQGTRAVTKTLVARVAYQIDRVRPTNWSIHVFTREGADMLRIQYAINTTRKKLLRRYDLRPNPELITHKRNGPS